MKFAKGQLSSLSMNWQAVYFLMHFFVANVSCAAELWIYSTAMLWICSNSMIDSRLGYSFCQEEGPEQTAVDLRYWCWSDRELTEWLSFFALPFVGLTDFIRKCFEGAFTLPFVLNFV